MQLAQLGITNTFLSRGVSGIDAEWANSSGEVLFVIQSDSTGINSNNSTGPGPANNGKRWNGSAFVDLGTVGPGDSGAAGTDDGSICQQFALDYYTRTGKVACFVNSGVGGSSCVTQWNGVSTVFNDSMTEVAQAITAGGFPKVRFILSALVNDSTAGDTVPTVNSAFNAWIDAINTAYPDTEIYYLMFGVKNAQNATRAAQIRCNVREKWIATSNMHITHSDLYLADWGLISGDGVHPTQTGHNFRGAKIDTYLAMESLGYSKFGRTAINSYYSTLGSTEAAAFNTCIAGSVADGDWHNTTSGWIFDLPAANDRFVDLALISRLTDRGVTFNADASITTNTGQTLNLPVTPTSVPWRTHSNTDTFLLIRFADVIAAPAGSTKIAAGVSTGTTIFAAQQSTAGLISFFVWGNTGPTKTGGYQDNTAYSWGREGTAAPGGAGGDVVSWINGVENARATAAAGAANSSGPEIGDRYTAGPAGFALNAEYKYVFMGLGSSVNQANLYARLETLLAAI
jgi:hypothetical protein